MYRTLNRLSMEATGHLLVAATCLILLSLAGVGGSPVAVGLSVVVAVALFLARERLASVGADVGYAAGQYLQTAWIGPTLAATTALLAWGATSGEIQSLGGVLGLAGMVNYFLRPVYFGVYEVAVSVAGKTRMDSR